MEIAQESRAWAKLMLQRGAHGLQLFNWGHLLYGHGPGTDPRAPRLGTVWYHELHPDYYTALHELGDVNTFSFKNCRYVWESNSHKMGDGEFGITHRRHRAIDDIALPVVLDAGRHTVPFGFAEDLARARSLGLKPKVILWTLIENSEKLADVELQINGHALRNKPFEIADRRHAFRDGYTRLAGPREARLIPDEFLKKSENELAIEVKKLRDGAVPQLNNMEIDVRYVDRAHRPLAKPNRASVPIHDIRLPVELSVGKHAVAFRIERKQIDTTIKKTHNLQLRLRINNYTYYDDFDVILNGHRLSAKHRTTRAIFIMNNDSWLTYPVDKAQLVPGDNMLVVEMRKLNPMISVVPKLVGLELAVD